MASLFERLLGRLPAPFEPPAPPAGDILSEDRERRSRGLTARLPFLRLLSGRALAFVVAAAVVAGLGLAFVRNGPPQAGAGFGGGYAPAEVAPHPEAGRALRGTEILQAEWLGRPLRLGESGLPVVELDATGEVREMTPLEVEHWRDTSGGIRAFLPAGFNGVVWNPGPGGGGMWWRDNSASLELLPDLAFARERWRARQEDELGRAVRLLSLGLLELDRYDYENWREGPSERLSLIMAELRAVHPVVEEHGLWTGVPGQWVCDEALEIRYTLGVTQGCPPAHYMDFLYEAWGRLGAVADRLSGIARLGMVIDDLPARDFYGSTVGGELVFAVIDLEEPVLDLIAALEGLRQVSVGQELPIVARLFERVDI